MPLDRPSRPSLLTSAAVPRPLASQPRPLFVLGARQPSPSIGPNALLLLSGVVPRAWTSMHPLAVPPSLLPRPPLLLLQPRLPRLQLLTLRSPLLLLTRFLLLLSFLPLALSLLFLLLSSRCLTLTPSPLCRLLCPPSLQFIPQPRFLLLFCPLLLPLFCLLFPLQLSVVSSRYSFQFLYFSYIA